MKPFSEEKKKMLREYLFNKKLSKCEVEVVILVVQGLINREVANKLCVAEKTVKFHLTNVYKKLNISRRSQLVWTLPLIDFVGAPEPPVIRPEPRAAETAAATRPNEAIIGREERKECAEASIPIGSSTVSDCIE